MGSMKKDTNKKVLRRLKIVEGQVRGIQKMIEDDLYCVDIINQSMAVKQALSGIEDAILRDHLSTCVVDQMRSGREKKAIEEILSVYKLSKKK